RFKRNVISQWSFVNGKFQTDNNPLNLTNDQCPMSNDYFYSTGDLARWLEDGNIEFIGRIDQQVKLRGFRIELGEIESRLLKYKLVKEAVVIDRINTDGNLYLCAYLVLHPAQTAQSTQMPQIPPGTTRLDTRELHEFLARQLPDYMIPSYFIEMQKIPLNANGKIDRRALPKPEITSLNDQTEYIPPGNTIEKTLAETWEKVLRRPHIGINENFFMIGGDSIKSIQVTARMNSAGYRMEMKDLFQYPTIAGLAPRVKKFKRFPGQSIVTGTIPLTPIQAMFFAQFHLHPHHFNQSVMLNAKERLDSNIIKNIFTKIQEHHDALRMTYDINSENGTVIQMDHGLPYPLSLDEFEMNDASPGLESLVEKIQASIDLEKGPLMKLGLFHFANGNSDKLLIVIHHLVIDGISWRILFEDIETLYKLYKQGEKLILPLKTDSFKLWAERLLLYANNNVFLKEKSHWQKVEALPAPLLIKDFDIADNNVKDSGHISFNLDEKETVQLLTKVNEAFKTEINDILLTALAKSINATFGINPILIALEGHGRESILEDIDISRTVGWFTTLYPVWFEVSNAGDNYQLKKIKEALRQVPNKGIGYGILKYLTGEDFKKETRFKLKPQIRFNYLGQFDADVKQISFFEIAKSTGNSHGLNNEREYLLEVSGLVMNNRLEMTIFFNKTHFKPGTMSTLANNLETELKSIIAFCCSREKIEYTPSDFNCRSLSIESVDMVMGLFPGVEDLYALTPMQEGMLFHALTDESSHSYFEQMSYRLHGKLDIIAAEKSLNELFKRHDILRTAFVYKDIEHPVQVVLKKRIIDFHHQDITKKENKNIFIKEFKEKDKQRSFDLCRDGLMRVAILQLGEMEYEFIWSSHHIIIDGWCFGILNNEFFEIYASIIKN
ncbi:MAG: condensation domain-containing protein, partial [Acidobacteria bacterium]|nr:condensation domain-containing protein [Acidobacteriota bacterium]